MCNHVLIVSSKLAKNVRSYIYYTTKIVPERYLPDNEEKDEKGGMVKVCDFAHFLCEIAHTAHKNYAYICKKNLKYPQKHGRKRKNIYS